LDRVYAFARQRIQPQIGLDLLWRTLTGGNHYNHVHMGVQGRYAHNVALMRKFLATLPKGGGDFSLDGIKRVRSRARGVFGQISQVALDLARRAANEILNSAADQSFMDGGSGDVGQREETPHSGGVLSRSRVASIFQRAFAEALPYQGFSRVEPGWLSNLMNLAMEESSWNPNAQNKTAAGLAAGLPQGILQVVGNTFRAYAKPGMNNPFNPLHNAVASIRYQLTRYGGIRRHAPYAAGGFVGDHIPQFAAGGIVPGGEGSPRPIVAHAGEWVLNKLQQSKIAALAGTTRDRLKDALGFTGGPSGFAGGGEVRGGELVNFAFDERGRQVQTGTAIFKRLQAILKGVYEAPLNALTTIEQISTEISRVFRAISNIPRTNTTKIRRLTREIEELEKGKEDKDQKKEISKLKKQLEKLEDGDRFKQISDNLDALTGEGGLLDQLSTQTEQLTERLATKTLRGAVGAIKGAKLVIDGRAQALLRSTRSETRQIEVELKNLAEVSSALYGERSGIVRATRSNNRVLREINREIRSIERGGVTKKEQDRYKELLKDQHREEARGVDLRNRRAEIDASLAQNINDRLERQRDLFEAQTQEGLRGSALRVGGTRARVGVDLVLRALDSMQSITEAFGRDTAESVESLGQQRLAALGNKRQQLIQRRDEAIRRGYTDIAESLQEEIDTLSNDIQTGVAELLNSVIGKVQEKFDRERSRLDRFERLGNALGAIGLDSVIGGTGLSARGIANQRNALLAQENVELQALRDRAAREGNVGALNALTDKIEDNIVAIAENTASIKDRAIEEATRESQQASGRANTLTQIFELQRKLGLVTGDVQRSSTKAALESVGEALRRDANRLAGELAGANPAQQQRIQDALDENTLAQLQNTDAIKTLEGAINVQSFTSSFWTGFRQALFTGEGALVPRFSSPVSTFGATAMWPGSLPSGSMASSASTQNIVNFDIDRAGDPIDANEIVSKVLFATGSRDR
jgi:hypothetical protein